MKGRMFVIFLLLAGSVAAQPDAGSIIRRVRVRVAFGSGGCDAPAHVSLVGHSGPVAEGTTNDRCEVDFFNLPEATYHLIVSAGSFANADMGSINLTSGGPAEFEVQVKRPNELDRTYAVPGNAFVSASDLGVPSRARKEFDKANELIGKQDLGQAIQKLNKAISIYPAYAVAYNNLGVIYSRLEDPVREREALQKAISLNDHFALAYVNLGRMNIAAGDFPESGDRAGQGFHVGSCRPDGAHPALLVGVHAAAFRTSHRDQPQGACARQASCLCASGGGARL